ncbi:Palmdelphin [Larimichthys crocea]|uniref:Uncharacterized protein n=1 Tax=Larimichthys crocea TaxID=215358 RepID=A0ACD3R807_LARCR|nr:Palmdelphin [Larimichthys crocea]
MNIFCEPPASCERPGMDEAETYQQRLQAIASLFKDSCFLLSPGEASTAGRREEAEEGDRGGVVKDGPEKEEKLEGAVAQRDTSTSTSCPSFTRQLETLSTITGRSRRAHSSAGTDGDVQEHKEAENHFSILMAQRMFHESGQDGRSVLGTVAVQVERDPKTGATVVRSVAPVSAPAGAPMATTVFDDGRKSIHCCWRGGRSTLNRRARTDLERYRWGRDESAAG